MLPLGSIGARTHSRGYPRASASAHAYSHYPFLSPLWPRSTAQAEKKKRRYDDDSEEDKPKKSKAKKRYDDSVRPPDYL
eukprot:3495433-Prymnesium_polylepis.1